MAGMARERTGFRAEDSLPAIRRAMAAKGEGGLVSGGNRDAWRETVREFRAKDAMAAKAGSGPGFVQTVDKAFDVLLEEFAAEIDEEPEPKSKIGRAHV